eukprot:Lankesteria_metandrocarpae@DN10413_c0_g1_i1.p1
MGSLEYEDAIATTRPAAFVQSPRSDLSDETLTTNSDGDATDDSRVAVKDFVYLGVHGAPPPESLLEPADAYTRQASTPTDEKDNKSSFATTAAWMVDDDQIFNIEISEDLQNEAVQLGGELSMSDIDEKYNQRLARARCLSYIGFAVSMIQGSVAMGFGISTGVVSLTAMGAQICIDLLSSVMVVWRFYTRAGSTQRNPRHADPDTRLREALREKRAALGVGILLCLTAIWAASWAFVKVFGPPPPPETRIDRARVTLSVAWPGFVVFSIISVFKWNSALKLRSRVLQKDAVCSTFGATLSFITALFATIEYAISGTESHTGAADSVAALIMAALLMVEGVRTIFQNSVGWVPPSGVTKTTIEQYYQSRRAGE